MKPIQRIIRFLAPNGECYLGEQVKPSSATATVLKGNLFDGSLSRTNETLEVQKLLAPLVPHDIFCIGMNYMKHYEEGGKKLGVPLPTKPVIFMKARGCLANPEQDIWMPELEKGDHLDWEAELTVIIGKPCRNVSKERALDYVFGYTVGNDVTSRHWQRNAGASQWIKGKSFDTFAPIGPCIVTTDLIKDPQALQISSRVNGVVQQNDNTSDMIFSVAEIIQWLSKDTTLLPGSIIMTGTPAGVAMGRDPPNWLKVNDVVECEISGIGVLRNKVAKAPKSNL